MSTVRTITLRRVCTVVCLLVVWLLLQRDRSLWAAERLPNFVVIFADDLGYGDLGCYGNKTIRTPHLDRMAREGMRFTDFYSCACVCTPARVGLLTGRYQVRSGLTRVLFPRDKAGLPADEITIAKALKPLGYRTGIVGKWHLGSQREHLPVRHGFDSYFGIPYSNDMSPTLLYRDETVLEEGPSMSTLQQRYTLESIKFLGENKDRPFFLYLAHSMPHVPLGASEEFRGKSACGLYGDVIEELDWSVGKIFETLKKHQLDDNTLVIFSSDNGPWLIKKEWGGSAGGLRSGKGTTFEGGVRVPCLVRWPGKVPAGTVHKSPAIMLDWWPTLVSLAEGDKPDHHIIDGRDLSRVLKGEGERDGSDFFFYHGDKLQAHRSGPWKLKFAHAEKVRGKTVLHSDLLFNLETDPQETTNVAHKYPEIVKRLKQQVRDFEQTLSRP